MTQVVSFTGYTPPARFDADPWTSVRIQEASSETGTYTTIDTVALSPDADPSDPASRDFTTHLGTAPDLWYRVLFLDAGLNQSQPTTPVQNVSDSVAAISADAYVTAAELAGILKIRDASADQTAKLERVLSVAAGEINSEIGRSNGDLSSWELDLAAQVNLDRAADLWRHTESVPGIGTILDADIAISPGRYSWQRYAERLAPLKAEWGLA